MADTRTFLPTHIGVGHVDMNGRTAGVLRLVGRMTGEDDTTELDVLLTPAALGQTVAACDELREQIRGA